MPQKQTNRTKVVVTIIFLLLLAGVALYFLFTMFNKSATPEPVQKSTFTFDAAQAPGWWAAENYWTDPGEFTGDQKQNPEDISAVGRVITQGDGPNEINNNGCFTMFNYYEHPGDPAKLLENKKQTMVAHDETLSLKQVGQESLQMKIFGQPTDYKFYTFETVGAEGQSIMRGNGLGYAATNDGYVSINTICQTAGEVAGSIPALKATSLAKQ